jgi:hypothetical protein
MFSLVVCSTESHNIVLSLRYLVSSGGQVPLGVCSTESHSVVLSLGYLVSSGGEVPLERH